VYLAYTDDSGNSGPPAAGGSLSYVLSCVLVEARLWADIFDDLIEHRRFLRRNFGIPVRAELKANYLLRNRGPLHERPLSEGARSRIYRGFMRLQEKLEVKTFAVVVRKEIMVQRHDLRDPRVVAWDYMLQRLERFSTKTGNPLVLIHDEGEAAMIRKATRRARRAGIAGSAYGHGMLKRPARLLIDDPVPRRSDQSYFIQLADLNAYAAFRHFYPPPNHPIQIVPQTTWESLGEARYAPVSGLAGGPRGLVTAP
jgi:hypothetical protein